MAETIFRILPMHKASVDDIKAILNIRNQEYVRKQMFDTSIISFENHMQWWSLKSSSLDEFGFIVKISDVPVGFYRFWFDTRFNAGNWSMFTDTTINNKKLGVYTEYNALKYFFQSPVNLNNEIVSEVKKDNLIIKLHYKIGFRHEVNPELSPGWVLMRNNITNFNNCKYRFESVLGLSKKNYLPRHLTA